MILNIHNLPIGNEEELVLAIKQAVRNQRVDKIWISPSQAKWFTKLATAYTHGRSDTSPPTITNEYVSPFGEHEWEIKEND